MDLERRKRDVAGRVAWCMHRWVLCLVVVPLLLPLGGADPGHGQGPLPPGSYLNHVVLATADLAPGDQAEWTLAYMGHPLQEGWHWLVRADVAGQVVASLHMESWQVQYAWGEGQRAETTVLPHTGTGTFRIVNVGDQNASVRFYYDQTCDCTAKPVPLSPGIVWFNADARQGERVRMEMYVHPMQTVIDATPMPTNITISARYLVPDDQDGFQPLGRVDRTFRTDEPPCDPRPTRWNGCLELSFEARHDGRQLVMVHVNDDAATWDVLVAPVVDVVAAEQGLPWPLAAPLAALALVAHGRRKAARR